MLQSVAQGVKTIADAWIVGEGWVTEIGHTPPTPDLVVSIFDSGGLPANPSYLLDFPSVQVQVRGVVGGYVAAHQVATGIKDLLIGRDPGDVDGDRWVSITLGSDVTFIGMDENQRPMFTVNFRLIIEPALSAESNRVAL